MAKCSDHRRVQRDRRELCPPARRPGTDLILVARRADLLERLAADLRAEFSVSVEVLPADLTAVVGRAEVGTAGIGAVEVRAAEVELLVNNAGFGAFGSFAELALADQLGQIALNVTALTRLTSAALPRKPQGVHMTALCPGFTRTEDGASTGLMWLSREEVAAAG